ncbi:hypothetical protein LTR17_018076 [Elasticomyces elasticus]|nr:hypothetical protein LTR17_018076 [Elasticomyces elasticus]
MAGGKRQSADGGYQPSKKHQTNTSSARPTTRLTTKHSVINAVLLTTELLEHVLSQLPMKDLLLAQRVSRNWRNAIRQSPEWQQQLFMRPLREKFIWNLTLPDYDMGSGHTLMRIKADLYSQAPENYPNALRAGDINEKLVQLVCLYDLFHSAGARNKVPHGPQESLKFRVQLLALDCPTASWRKMLLTQPPVYKVSTHFKVNGQNIVTNDAVYSSGVTMGDVVKPFERSYTSRV